MVEAEKEKAKSIYKKILIDEFTKLDPTAKLDYAPKKPTAEEVRREELHEQKVERKKLKNSGSFQDQKLKSQIFRWVKFVVIAYLVFVGIIIASITFNFGHLTDKVVVALLTTTTLNILGLPYLIISSLFPKSSRNKGKKLNPLLRSD